MLKRDPVFFVNAVPLLLVVSDSSRLSIKTVSNFSFLVFQFDSHMKIFPQLKQRESLAANKPGSPRTDVYSCYSGPLNHCHGQGSSSCCSIIEACIAPKLYPWRISKYRNVTTVLSTPQMPWYPIVVRVQTHAAFALSRFCVANTVGI